MGPGDDVPAALHDGEVAVTVETVRALVADERPEWADHDVVALPPTGTDNALWRLRRPDGPDLVIRLPRTDSAARSLATEVQVLDQLAGRRLPVAVPVVRHLGRPTGDFPRPWAVLEWLDGVDAWRHRDRTPADDEALAAQLAEAVLAIGALDGVTAPDRPPGRRGGPLPPLLDAIDRWLDDPAWSASAHLDVAAVRRLADQGREVAGEEIEPRFVHGDLLPGNLLLSDGRLGALIDWGSAALADPAQDLAPAWAVLGARGRRVFRRSLGVDEAAWRRGRTFELEHAVGAILYYRPRRHPLADIMARTLDRLLADAAEPGHG